MLPIQAISAAISKRTKQLQSGINCLRLFDGDGDGIPGLVIDRHGSTAVLHLFDGVISEEISGTILEEGNSSAERPSQLVKELSPWVSSAIIRHRFSNPANAEPLVQALFGTPPEMEIVSEEGMKFIVRPLTQVNAGLFLDTRSVRKKLVHQTRRSKVINTFCFTGSLGIAAAIGGASEVIQIDSSAKILDWAKENWLLNQKPSVDGIAETTMRFITEDALTFLMRESRRVERGGLPADLVIIDPPVFGNSKKGRFNLERDLVSLLAAGFACLKREGDSALVLMVNAPHIIPSELESLVKSQAAHSNRKVKSIETLLPCAGEFTSHLVKTQCMRGVWVSLR